MVCLCQAVTNGSGGESRRYNRYRLKNPRRNLTDCVHVIITGRQVIENF